jgi:hypothetical protein
VEDLNLGTATLTHERGEMIRRKAELAAVSGWIKVSVNCGQQLQDVIDLTDARAGLAAVKKRVIGIDLVYNPRKGEYEQKIELGGV